MMLKTTIPFSGCYESLHDSEIDRAVESAFQDDTGEVSDHGLELLNKLWGEINVHPVRRAYAAAYAGKFAEEFKIDGLIFETMVSPREYNFTTDRIFCLMPLDTAERLYAGVNKSDFREHVKRRFTSRDGFASFYSGNLDEWPVELSEWDHNQIGALLEFLAGEDFDQWTEHALCEDFSCNGLIDNWLCSSCPEFVRLSRIHSYLQERKTR